MIMSMGFRNSTPVMLWMNHGTNICCASMTADFAECNFQYHEVLWLHHCMPLLGIFDASCLQTRRQLVRDKLKDLVLSWTDISLGEVIGVGGYGHVYRATLKVGGVGRVDGVGEWTMRIWTT